MPKLIDEEGVMIVSMCYLNVCADSYVVLISMEYGVILIRVRW